jgi:uncharacterized protein
MKLLLVLVVLLFGVWLWRSRRIADKPAPPRPPKVLPSMVTCEVCGLHLPQSEALVTERGVYCSPQHQQQAQQ